MGARAWWGPCTTAHRSLRVHAHAQLLAAHLLAPGTRRWAGHLQWLRQWWRQAPGSAAWPPALVWSGEVLSLRARRRGSISWQKQQLGLCACCVCFASGAGLQRGPQRAKRGGQKGFARACCPAFFRGPQMLRWHTGMHQGRPRRSRGFLRIRASLRLSTLEGDRSVRQTTAHTRPRQVNQAVGGLPQAADRAPPSKASQGGKCGGRTVGLRVGGQEEETGG